MTSTPRSDREVLDAIGDEALLAAGCSEHQTKKWRNKRRGIPWKDRGKVAEIARAKRIKLPADFLTERVAA